MTIEITKRNIEKLTPTQTGSYSMNKSVRRNLVPNLRFAAVGITTDADYD